MTNIELNKAILKVLTSLYKNQCEEEYKMVKKAGYSIRKEDEHFRVYAPESQWRKYEYEYPRYVYLTWRTTWCHPHAEKCYFLHSNIERYSRKVSNLAMVDFVNLLATPRNYDYEEYCAIQRRMNRRSKAYTKYDDLKWCRFYVENSKASTDAIKAQIQSLTNQLERQIRTTARYENELEEKRKELGLA